MASKSNPRQSAIGDDVVRQIKSWAHGLGRQRGGSRPPPPASQVRIDDLAHTHRSTLNFLLRDSAVTDALARVLRSSSRQGHEQDELVDLSKKFLAEACRAHAAESARAVGKPSSRSAPTRSQRIADLTQLSAQCKALAKNLADVRDIVGPGLQLNYLIDRHERGNPDGHYYVRKQSNRNWARRAGPQILDILPALASELMETAGALQAATERQRQTEGSRANAYSLADVLLAESLQFGSRGRDGRQIPAFPLVASILTSLNPEVGLSISFLRKRWDNRGPT